MSINKDDPFSQHVTNNCVNNNWFTHSSITY